MSQRLGHTSVRFTLAVYSHAVPGYDGAAVDVMAALILGETGDDESAQRPQGTSRHR